MNLYEMHEKLTGHLFPAYSNTDERFLALALCGEAGELRRKSWELATRKSRSYATPATR